jgi:hypothetical protein
MATPKLAMLISQAQTELRTAGKGYITDTEYGDLIDAASNKLTNFLLGLVSNYQLGHPVPPVSSEVTSDVDELLQPIRPAGGVSVPFTGGYWVLPNSANAVKVESWEADGAVCRKPTKQRRNAFTQSNIRGGTVAHPVILLEGEYKATVSPVPTVLKARVLYSLPKSVVVFDSDYKLIENDSIELAWGPRAIPYLLNYILTTFGVGTQALPLMQFGMAETKTAI